MLILLWDCSAIFRPQKELKAVMREEKTKPMVLASKSFWFSAVGVNLVFSIALVKTVSTDLQVYSGVSEEPHIW
jgi:hypothetical protein